MKRLMALAVVLCALAGSARAHDGGIAIDDAWALPAQADAMGSTVYLTILDSTSSDRLVAAQTPVAAGAAFHRDGSHLGVMRTGDIKGIDVDKGTPLVLSPDGYSLILTGLIRPLQVGDTFPLTLIFEHAGSVDTVVTVQVSGNTRMQDR